MTRVAGDKEGNGKGARGGGRMMAMGHGLCVFFCVCGETPKIRSDLKTGECDLELKARISVSNR